MGGSHLRISAQRRTGLNGAIADLNSELRLDQIFQRVTDLSRELANAQYCALGVLGPEGKLVQFVTSGTSEDTRKLIGNPPEGEGVLGVMLQEGSPMLLADVTKHPKFLGFPLHHPPMKSLLGVPIIFRDQVLGDLYLADKIGAEEFSTLDETVVALFAS